MLLHSGFVRGCLVFFLVFLLCQGNAARAQRYPFFNLNVENGLIQSQPRAMVQDRLGHLWIGTLGGVSRYDGQSFTNYSIRDGMPGNTVNAIETDRSGNIWLGGAYGIAKYDGKSFKLIPFPLSSGLNSNAVFQIRAQENGVVWCIAGNKLFSIFRDTARQLRTPNPATLFSAILPGKAELLAASLNMIYRYRQHKWDSLSIPAQPLGFNTVVYQIFRDSRQKIWIASNTGLYTIDSGRIMRATFGGRLIDNLPGLLSITEDRTGSLWFGTNAGVIRLSEGGLHYFNKKSGLSDNTFFSLLTDSEGNVWMASDGQGIFRYSGTQFTVVDESTGLPSGQVMSIETDHNGQLFLGTYDAGLYIYRDGNVSSLGIPLEIPPAITALKYRNGSLWIGTRGAGLWRYNGKYFFSFLAGSSRILSNSISSMYTDEMNRLWIGFGNGAMMYDNDSFSVVSSDNVVFQDFIQLDGDSVLMATSNGLKLCYKGTVYSYEMGNLLDTALPQCFAKRGRELWTGTSDNGIVVYNLDTKKSLLIDKSTGLQSDFIYNITVDNSGNVWAGTGYGIHRISMDAEGNPSIYFYGKGYGMKGMESNHKAVLKMNDGSIWFGTTNGALHYKPQSQLVVPQPASIVMQSVKLFGESDIDSSYFDSTDVWYHVPYDLRLPYKKNNITFTFHAISLGNNEQIKYRYRIDGLDAPWSEWSSTYTVTYSALPPGKYTFRVQCMAWGASQQPKELLYPFEIITPFHKTDLFRLIVLAACILLGISIQYIVNLRKQNRLRLLETLRREEQNKVRQRTAEDFHDEVGNRLTRINVLTNVLKNKMEKKTPETERILEKIQENTAQLYSGTRDILWSLKPSNDNLTEILHRIRDFGGELFQDTEIDFDFINYDESWKNYRLPLDVSRNLIMIFKEALNNCLKYANATSVKLEAYLKENDSLQMILTDNGVGFDVHYVKKGHGIDNMNVRAGRIHGRLYIDSAKGKGTIITLTFRLPKNSTLKKGI